MTGDAPHVLDPDLLRDGPPHARLARLRAEAPVVRQTTGAGDDYWAVLSHAEVLRVSREPATFSAFRRGISLVDDVHELPTLLSLDPPEHTELRRRVLHAFTPRVARDLEPRIRAIVDETFTRAAEAARCDFVSELAAPLPLQVIGDILGIPPEDRPMVAEWADALAGAADPEIGARLGGKDPNQSALEFGTYAFQLGQKAQGRGREGDDLIAVLLGAERGGAQVDLPTFAGLFVQIAIAGNETTRSLLAGGMLELLRRPDDYRALEADPTLVPGAVEEMLRWLSPVYYFRRTATCDTELGGVPIAEGDRVVMVYPAANRDPDAFHEPERFDVRRDPNPHVAFGFGEHFCLGAALGRLEARIFFETWFERFRGLELAREPERLRSNELHAWKRMPVRVHPR